MRMPTSNQQLSRSRSQRTSLSRQLEDEVVAGKGECTIAWEVNDTGRDS